MIDIHSHILNNVDDGANSLDNTLQILTKAEKAGFSDIILTPHYIEGYYENTRQLIHEKIKPLKQVLYKEELAITLHQGNEIFLTENTPRLIEELQVSTLANGRYVLFEIPFTSKMLNLEQIMYNLIDLGCIPIIAHPERYTFIQENPANIIPLIKMGVLVQCNYGSFVGSYGKAAKNTAEILLENKLVHFLGTDTHRQGYIYDNIDQILRRLENVSGDERYINELTTINPKKVLEDEDIYVECPDGLRAKKKVFFFF